jgi:hypothetical protein
VCGKRYVAIAERCAVHLIRRDRERKTADEQITSLKIKTPAETLVVNLSGETN